MAKYGKQKLNKTRKEQLSFQQHYIVPMFQMHPPKSVP